MVGLSVSVVIFAVVYFTVIQPDQNTANQALKTACNRLSRRSIRLRSSSAALAARRPAAGTPSSSSKAQS